MVNHNKGSISSRSSPVPNPITSERAAFWFIALGTPLVALHASQLVGDAAFAVLGIAGVVVSVIGLRRNRPRPSWAWWCLLGSAVLFTIGGAIRDTVDAVSDLSADRSLAADWVTFPAYMLLAASLLAIVHARGRPMHTAGISLDAGIIGLALLMVAWALIVDPMLVDLDASPRARLAIAVYPPVMVLLAAVVARLAFTVEDRTWSTRLVLAGTISFLVGDVLFVLTEIQAIDLPGRLLDAPFGFAWLFFGGAVLHPSISRPGPSPIDADDGFPRTRLAVIGVSLLVPAALFIVWAPSDTASRVVVGLLSAAIAGTVVVRVFVALSQQQRTQRRLSMLAHYDDLTGLPNRSLLIDRIEALLRSTARERAPLSLLFFDIDRFKMVNDTSGHAEGDRLLVACAERVVDTMPSAATVGRLSGDEFVVVLPGTDTAGAHRQAERLREAFLAPVPFGSDHFVTISVGVVSAHPDTERLDAATLLRDADTAMYLAKERGRDAVAVFDVSLRHRHSRRLDVERRLRHAIERDELTVHYQPVVSLPFGRLEGVEALVRWLPDSDPVETTEFITVAEESGLIATIGQLVMNEATRQVAIWRRRPGLEDLRLAVNVSARELLHGSISKVVRSALDSSGLDADVLWLEITERVLLEDSTVVTQRLEEVRALGAHISVDDFGTGYSALSYLKRFPVEQVKIDRSFVSGISSTRADSRDASLVAAIIALARALDLGVVAEGVETPDQAHRLIELGCERAQGWHFAPPASATDLDPFLQAQVDRRP